MDDARVQAFIERHGSARVVELLTPYLTEQRRAKIERVLDGRRDDVTVAIESPADPHNAAAVVRTAEAFGLMSVHVVAAEGDALRKKATTQGAFAWVDTHHHENLDELAAWLGGRHCIAGAWMDAAFEVHELPIDRPLCLMFGNENRGLSPAARGLCDVGFRIDMVGMSESLNLSVSAAISLHTTLARKRGPRGRQVGNLDAAQKDRLRSVYYARSVDARLLQALAQ